MTRWDCNTMFELYDELRRELSTYHARAWLVTPLAKLGDRAPCELIETPAGLQRVQRALRVATGQELEETARSVP